MKTRKATCQVCGTTWLHERSGHLPKYCVEHIPSRNRARRAAEAEARGEHEEAERIRTGAGSVTTADATSAKALQPALLAAGLQITSNPAAAAAIAGLGRVPKEHLRRLETVARRDYAALIEGNASAIQALGFAGLSLALLRAISALDRVPPGQRASGARAIIDTLERLQNAARPSFGDMTIRLVEVEEDDAA